MQRVRSWCRPSPLRWRPGWNDWLGTRGGARLLGAAAKERAEREYSIEAYRGRLGRAYQLLAGG